MIEVQYFLTNAVIDENEKDIPVSHAIRVVFASHFDRVTAERDAALLELSEIKESLAYRGSLLCRIEGQRDAMQQLLTAADERADVMEAENRRLREDELFYDSACEAMEGHQKERAKLGKEIGCQGSLIDGIAWLYRRLAELEKSPSGYTKQHHPVEFGPSDSRRIGCSCGHSDPNHMIELKPAEAERQTLVMQYAGCGGEPIQVGPNTFYPIDNGNKMCDCNQGRLACNGQCRPVEGGGDE